MHRSSICLGFAVAIVGASSAVAASATLVGLDDFVVVDDVTGVTVQDAWAHATPGTAGTASVYVALMGGAQADALIGAGTPVAKAALAKPPAVGDSFSLTLQFQHAPAVTVQVKVRALGSKSDGGMGNMKM